MPEVAQLVSAAAVSGVFAILVSTRELLNLDKQFVAYAVYHQDHVNKLAHEVCVWPIFLTFLVLFQYTKPVIPGLPFSNHAFVVAALYAGFYLALEQTVYTAAAAGTVCACFITAALMRKYVPKAAAVAIVINVACWVVQFYTHAKHEGRAPALLKNPAQAFFLAPLFVLLEVLFDNGVALDRQQHFDPLVKDGLALIAQNRAQEVSLLEFRPAAAAGCAALFVVLLRDASSTSKAKAQ